MLCVLYVNVVGLGLGIVGLLVERVLPATFPRRWVWCAVIALSVALPPLYRTYHTSVVNDFDSSSTAASSLHLPPMNPLDREWWAHTGAYDNVVQNAWGIASQGLVVWGVGSALWLAVMIRISRKRRSIEDGPDFVDGVPVILTDTLGPATVGVWRSRVLLPRWVLALPGAQRQYVLRHEDEHRRANDARMLFLGSLPLILLPWNIAFWWQLRRLRLAVEMDCDNRVVGALGNAREYGELLLRVAQAASRGPRIQPAFLGAGMLERRLTALVAPAPLQRAQRLILPVVAAGLLLLVLSMPHPVIGQAHVHGADTAAASHSATNND